MRLPCRDSPPIRGQRSSAGCTEVPLLREDWRSGALPPDNLRPGRQEPRPGWGKCQGSPYSVQGLSDLTESWEKAPTARWWSGSRPARSCTMPGSSGGSTRRLSEAKREVGLSLIHISEPTRRTPISYAVFCLKKKKITKNKNLIN